jgi:hypothetical protein
MRLLRALPALCLLTAALTARAQYSIANIAIENAAPYTDAEILTVSGLAPDQLLTHDSLTNADQHLIDTGLFDDAQVSLSGQGKARTVHVALKPIPLDRLLPVSLENFVWFTPEELTQGIHALVPLYRGVAAEAGNTPDSIQTALQQMLAAKGIDAKLSFQVVPPTAQHPARVVNFRINRPSIRLADVKLSISAPPGAAAQLTPGFQAAVNRATHSPFNEGLTGTTIADLLLPPARNFGYINAHLDNISRTIAPSATGIAVTYTTRVVTGEAYKLASVTWQPTPIYTAADFARDNKLHPGDLASIYLLNQTNAAIVAAYLAAGYMDAVVLSPPILDETSHTVAYAPKVIPGEVYRVKSVTPQNLAPDAQKEFDANWRMKPGEPYSATYVEHFIQTNTALPHLATYTASYQASADPATHLVDLTITFFPSAH